MAIEKYLLGGSVTTLLSTGLNSLANNALAAGASYSNIQGGAGDGYTLCMIEFLGSFPGGAILVNTGLSIWFCQSLDGTTFETGFDATTTPARPADLVIPLLAIVGVQRVTRRIILPQGIWIPVVKNDGTTQPLAATGNTLKLLTGTYQGV